MEQASISQFLIQSFEAVRSRAAAARPSSSAARRLAVRAQPSGRAANNEDFSERSTLDLVAGGAITEKLKMFPVTCKNCGQTLNNVDDLPCPKCGCDQAIVHMAARTMAAASGRATMSGHKTEKETQKSWPYIILLVAIVLISGYPAYYLSGWNSVVVSWFFSAVSTVVGYYAITKFVRTVRVF